MSEMEERVLENHEIEENDMVILSIQDAAELEMLIGCGFQVIPWQGWKPKGYVLLIKQQSEVSINDGEKEQKYEGGVNSSVEPEADISSSDEGWDEDEDDEYRGKPNEESSREGWEWSTERVFNFCKNVQIQLPAAERVTAGVQEEQLTMEATFKTVCSRRQQSQETRKLWMFLDSLHFGVAKTDSERGMRSAQGGANGVRFIYNVEIEVKPAVNSEWLSKVESWPDDTNPQELNLQTSKNMGIELSPFNPKSLLKLSAARTSSTAVKASEHKWFSKRYIEDKSVFWTWMMQYFLDGHKFDASPRRMLFRDPEFIKNLLPIQPESVQMSRPDLQVEAVWTLNDGSLGASEIPFEIDITIHTTVIRRYLFLKNALLWRTPASFEHSQKLDHWSIVVPLTSSHNQ